MRIDANIEYELLSERLIIKVLNGAFSMQTLDYYLENREFFQESMPKFPDEFFTYEYQKARYWQEYDRMLADTQIRFYFFEKDDVKFEKIIGDVVFQNVQRGAAWSAEIGVKLHKDYTSMGYMREACIELLNFMFNLQKLHRITASILPDNQDSIKLFEKLGFELEGRTRKSILIDGRWQDHLQYSILKEEYNKLYGV
jgi:ribosomal-protein-alanine N-acetyltransferase